MKLYINNQSGFAFPLAVFVVIIVTILTGIMMGSINNEFKTRGATEEIIATKYLAEAGIEHGIAATVKEINTIMAYSYSEDEVYDENGSNLIDLEHKSNIKENIISIVYDGNDLGAYAYQFEIDFSIRYIPGAGYRMVPVTNELTITTEGWRTAKKTYSMEVDIELDLSYTDGEVLGVRILNWSEYFN